MILASLADSAQYETLHPLFHKAFEYVKQNDLAQAPVGKIVLDDDKLFISVSDVTGKIADEAKLESHAKYIDIQMPLNAVEIIGFLPAGECRNPIDGYNTSKDITFFTDKPSAYVQVEPGQFVILFPHDGHAPCIGRGPMRKLVIKVLV